MPPAPPAPSSLPRTIARVVLGAFLLFAGVGHLTTQREAFQAQVPTWVPLDPDFVVVASGIVLLLITFRGPDAALEATTYDEEDGLSVDGARSDDG